MSQFEFDALKAQSGLALECAVKAASLAKFDNEIQRRVGFVYTQRGEFEEARVYVERALKLNPNDADALTVMGVYVTAIGEPSEEIVFCEKARSRRPYCTSASARRHDATSRTMDSYGCCVPNSLASMSGSYRHTPRLVTHGLAVNAV